MELQHVNVKIYLEGDLPVEPGQFINLFHRWIQQKELDELLIDVADYRHVPRGPSVMLIGHEADYSLDRTENRWGICYNRKAALPGDNRDRIRAAVVAAAKVCLLFQAEFAALRFNDRELKLTVSDRALAPNTPETWEAYRADFEAALSDLFGHGEFQLETPADPRSLFGVRVKFDKPFDLAALAQ